jgi:large subunit ribosomal protein L15
MRAKRPYAKRKKRVGHGPGSGHGKTATRGFKGQKSRTGGSGGRRGFEGGQNPLYRRIPKRGFNHPHKKDFSVINLGRLAALEATEITPDLLLKERVLRNLRDGLKILGQGELTKALTIKAHRFSGQAKQKIEAAGGKAVVI